MKSTKREQKNGRRRKGDEKEKRERKKGRRH